MQQKQLSNEKGMEIFPVFRQHATAERRASEDREHRDKKERKPEMRVEIKIQA